MFFYESLLTRALDGIDQTDIVAAILNVSYAILLFCFLFGLYQSFARGGDVRHLGVTGLKYLSMGLALLAYPAAFRSVNGMFNDVARFIDTRSGAADAFKSWLDQLFTYWATNGSIMSWQLLTTTIAALLNALLVVVGFIIFPISYTLFAFFYALYGCILYVVGPLILALYPVWGIGQMARTYLINLMIFNGWGVIYAILGALITAININQVSSLVADQSFLGQFAGLGTNTLLGLVSIFYSLAICLIPFIASRIVKGEVGTTLVTMVATAITATKMVPAAMSGASSGFGRSMGGSSPAPVAGATPPHGATPGRYQGFSVAHATGYAAGRTVGAIARRFR